MRTLEKVLSDLPAKRLAGVTIRAGELATLTDLRQAFQHAQADLAKSLGVGQNAVSRIEKRSDMLLSFDAT